MEGKTAVVTGGTRGIGEAVATELARQGASVVIVGRDVIRGHAVRDRMQHVSGNPAVQVVLADLSSLKQVRRLASAVAERWPRLDVLVNNAAAAFATRQTTAEGLERTFALNHLAPFLLTNLLLPQLTAARGRVVNVTSAAHRHARLDLEDLQAERRYSGLRAYARSKLANVLFSYELAERLRGRVSANCVHPGRVDTRPDHEAPFALRAFAATFGRWMSTPEQGAAGPVLLATDPELAETTGRYFERTRESDPNPQALDAGLRAQLWDASARLAGLA